MGSLGIHTSLEKDLSKPFIQLNDFNSVIGDLDVL